MGELNSYLLVARDLVLGQLRTMVPEDTRWTGGLYDLMLDYPMRPAKALRPALCIATCQALGGVPDAATPSAAALELFHNAFLIHDDVEDGSFKRRGEATLHRQHGASIAVNVGDGMLAVALRSLLRNTEVLDLGRALRILQVFTQMSQRTAEGQMLELAFIRDRNWELSDAEYVRMVHLKTGWYSFIAPVLVGAICAGAAHDERQRLGRYALALGIAFQIQDDLLNLRGNEADIGKEALGDLWEGKYTLVLLHALRTMTRQERGRALEILAKRRPPPKHSGGDPRYKSDVEVAALADMLCDEQRGSLAHARRVALAHAAFAARTLRGCHDFLPDSPHRRFLEGLVGYVIEREA